MWECVIERGEGCCFFLPGGKRTVLCKVNKEKNNITKQSNKQQQINKNLDNLIIDDINSDINDIDTINSTFNKKIYDNNSLSDIDII